MINYIIQVLLFQTLFLAVYDFFLSKETFFSKNRWYLLTTSILSFVLPFIKIPTFQKVVPEEISILLPEIVLSPQSVIEQTTIYQSIDYLGILFVSGFSIFLMVFIMKLYKLIRLILKNRIEDKGSYKLIIIPRTKKAFSFLNYIFLGEEVPSNEREKIIEHELIHSRQRHTYDLLFFEVLKVVMWFNPLTYIYQKRIATVHEFISDATVVKSTPKETYINKLMNELFDVENITFVNQFSKHSLLKKRILMMTKEKSRQIKQAKYLLLAPILVSMLFYISCSEQYVPDEEIITKQDISVDKSVQNLYLNHNGKIESYAGKNESYLDLYMGEVDNSFLTKEITKDDLNPQERKEYDTMIAKIEASVDKDSSMQSVVSYKIYRAENNRAVIVYVSDFSKMEKEKKNSEVNKNTEIYDEIQDIPFTIIDKVPTFPGCPDGNKKCFNKNLQKHFSKNFNSDLPKKLGLKPGKKRIIMLFKIDKEGNIRDIRVKAPDEKLKEESIRIIKLLPKMSPGEQDGKPVGVKYTLPMSIDVE